MRYPFIIFLLCFLLSNCDHDPQLPGYTGNNGEIIVVINNPYWNAKPGLSIKSNLSSPQYGLPQSEPEFDLVNIPFSAFTDVFKKHRNLFLIDISHKNTKDSLDVKFNQWAKGQIVIQITSRDVKGFLYIFKNNVSRIKNLFLNKEIYRKMQYNRKYCNHSIVDTISHRFNIILFPLKDSYLTQKTENFFWIRREKMIPQDGMNHQVNQDLFYTSFSYRDTSDLSIDHLLQMRDSITKRYLHGHKINTYMTVSRKFILPASNKIKFREFYAVEIRGLWRMKGEYLGGPFYELNILDSKKGIIHMIDGYVFAPQFTKREYLRELEAVAKSIQFK